MARSSGRSRVGGFDALIQAAEDHAHRSVTMLRDRSFGDTPIEALFSASLITVARWGHHCIEDLHYVSEQYPLERTQDVCASMGRIATTAFIERQVTVAGWRVDFLIHYPLFGLPVDQNGWPGLAKLIVECDGHDFHERTKEQAARDRSRDRLAQYHGLPVFRFTGSELWNDPVECATEVLSFMERDPMERQL